MSMLDFFDKLYKVETYYSKQGNGCYGLGQKMTIRRSITDNYCMSVMVFHHEAINEIMELIDQCKEINYFSITLHGDLYEFSRKVKHYHMNTHTGMKALDVNEWVMTCDLGSSFKKYRAELGYGELTKRKEYSWAWEYHHSKVAN